MSWNIKSPLLFIASVAFLTITFSGALFILAHNVLGFVDLTPGLVMASSVIIAFGFVWMLSGQKKLIRRSGTEIRNDTEQYLSGIFAGIIWPVIIMMVLDKKYFVFSKEPMIVSMLWMLGTAVLVFAGLYGLAKIMIKAYYKWKAIKAR